TDFFARLKPLGFQVEGTPQEENVGEATMPEFLKSKKEGKVAVLDVRPILDAGKDPLKQILAALKNLPGGHVLKILNTFAPSSLIGLVEKKGYVSYVEAEGADLVATYRHKKSQTQEVDVEIPDNEEWEADFMHFKDNLIAIDVRDLPMPQPMMAILDALKDLP